MKILRFRIQNFRSIVDSTKILLSPDGVTAFVGQNESGKSSVLDALYFALSSEMPTEDDFRIAADLPSVWLQVEVTFPEVEKRLKEIDEYTEALDPIIKKYLSESGNIVEILVEWVRVEGANTGGIDSEISIATPQLEAALASKAVGKLIRRAGTHLEIAGTQVAEVSTPEQIEFTANDFALAVWNALPLGVRFNEINGSLPNRVDVDVNGKPTGDGAHAAENFLSIADVNLTKLVGSDLRTAQTILGKANKKINEEISLLWSQTIGASSKLYLKCELRNHDEKAAEKAGRPHLVFWICDGSNQLYPKQRSSGVRWFISFFLQLKASEKRKARRIFLLDEPGANLHAKAQSDVLRLINALAKETSTVIYSTHSPHMIEYQRLYRVHAVQRSGEDDESPSFVIDAHRLGTASTDTLSPVLTAMGVDISHNEVIRKTNNVLLEEMSGYYYLTAFWRLTEEKKEVHFIASTGASKLPTLANMFVGWGLHFLVAVDDDKAGREAYKVIKAQIFGDNEEEASKRLIKIPDCPGIEDAFSKADFIKTVLEEKDVVFEVPNSEFLKNVGTSKPVLAYRFHLNVQDGLIKWADLSTETQLKIKKIVQKISDRLM